MKHFKIIIFLTLVSFGLLAQEDIKGNWQTGDENTIVEIYNKEGAIFGKIISSDNVKATIGMDVMKNFIYKDGKWSGEIYSLKKKKTYTSEFTLSGQILDIKVFATMGTKELQWERVTN